MQTYQERVGRYVILKHVVLPAEHQAEYRSKGIDPDTIWSLYYSTNNEADCIEVLKEAREDARWHTTYKMEDRGAPSTIERPVY